MLSIATSAKTKELATNEAIRAPQVRVIGDLGEQLGIMQTRDALNMAMDKGLDLVEIAPTAEIPVCKIMDYGKHKFEKAKKDKEAKKKQTVVEIKEIQFTPQIGEGDLETKVSNARRFLADGNKVKLVIKFRGRQMSHQELGVAVLEKVKTMCADLGSPEKNPNLEGRNLIMFLVPNKK